MPKINVNDCNLYYELHGSGDPIIFANGIFANTLSWFNQIPIFSKKYTVILYDMRGQGKSDHPEDNYSFNLHVEDQRALLDELGIEKVHHIGISYGSELGLIFTHKYPDMVKTLTICSGVTHLEPHLFHISKLWKTVCELADPMMFFWATVPFNFSSVYIKENQELLDQAKDRYKLFDYPAFVRLMDAFMELNITSKELTEIQIPTCIIAGEKDIIKPAKPYSFLMHDKIPNSELHIIPDSGHVIIWEKPAEFNSIVLGFLQKYTIR